MHLISQYRYIARPAHKTWARLSPRVDMPIPRRMKRPPAPDRAAKFRTFPKTVPSANHDIWNEPTANFLVLGPAPLPNVIRLALWQ
jgi:hypothetical protein